MIKQPSEVAGSALKPGVEAYIGWNAAECSIVLV